jgi:hypothetical protein
MTSHHLVAMVPQGPVVVARCGDDWLAGLWSGRWLWAGLGPMAGEVGMAGQGGPAEDGGEFFCLGSLAFSFGLDGREHSLCRLPRPAGWSPRR